MYQLDDTIVAVSSPTSDGRTIIRISGPGARGALRQVFSPPVGKVSGGVISGSVVVGPGLRTDANLYLFLGPHSYTGDDVAEIHVYSNSSFVEALMARLLGSEGISVRMAGPGEFTARAYLNGKMDLSQAEAVNETIVSSNKLQLRACERLLAGRLAETTAKVRLELIECLSSIETGLDFSGEDIDFQSGRDVVEALGHIRRELEQLLSGSISYEEVVDLPAVAIAGIPNAGKSSLLNRLLGRERSIVSEVRKTTRDVLSGLVSLKHCKCVLFDCAGLVPSPQGILDELAQEAAIEALRTSSVVVFCVDISKADYSEDFWAAELIEGRRQGNGIGAKGRSRALIGVGTKCDLSTEGVLAERLGILRRFFGTDFIAGSAKTGVGIERLRDVIDARMIALMSGPAGPEGAGSLAGSADGVALTARHRQAVIEAVESIRDSVDELAAGHEEVAALMLRAAHRSLSAIGFHDIDGQILERIFERFCIGK